MASYMVFDPFGEHLGDLDRLSLQATTDLPQDVYIRDPSGNWSYLLYGLSPVAPSAVPAQIRATALLLT